MFKLEHPQNLSSVKEVRFPRPSGNVVKFEHPPKRSYVKEVRFYQPKTLTLECVLAQVRVEDLYALR